ncbi:hypothetical protein [Fontimonas sp. SYSU GA230001]|uniref:hypothetical protein n=1 Tax=Fontimonas sp. SYSU GA230001 TaxID=3142450 RepID=UPI0032B5FAA5
MNAIRNGSAALVLLAAACMAAPAFAGGDGAIAKTLTELKGKRATLKLQSGQELTGVVVAVENDTVKLTELTGMEFFDAVIRTESIDAVVMRRAQQ